MKIIAIIRAHIIQIKEGTNTSFIFKKGNYFSYFVSMFFIQETRKDCFQCTEFSGLDYLDRSTEVVCFYKILSTFEFFCVLGTKAERRWTPSGRSSQQLAEERLIRSLGALPKTHAVGRNLYSHSPCNL